MAQADQAFAIASALEAAMSKKERSREQHDADLLSRVRHCSYITWQHINFFGSSGFWKVKGMGLEIFFCHHGLAPHFLINGPACCFQHLVCISWVVAVCFVECILCCWGITF